MNWDKEKIIELLENSDEMVRRSVVKIYQYQTDDEQRTEQTRHHNGVGFNGVDGEIMSSFAKQIMSGRKLTDNQLGMARKKIRKYAGQLTKIANGAM